MGQQLDVKDILQQVDDYDFEHLIADLWADQGWETRVLQASNDRGIDVEARRTDSFEQKHLIQAKRYSANNRVGSEMVQQYASLRHQEDNVDAVIIVTTSSFTRQATEMAIDLNIKLIDGDGLVRLIQERDAIDIVEKYSTDENNDIIDANVPDKSPTTQSLQTLDPAEVPNIYISKLVDNAIGDSITKDRLLKMKTGPFFARITTNNSILCYLYKGEQPHFALQCAKVRLPNQEVIESNGYFVATDHRIMNIVGKKKEEDVITTIPYRQITDVQTGIKLGTKEGPFKFAIIEKRYQETHTCLQYIKEIVYSLI